MKDMKSILKFDWTHKTHIWKESQICRSIAQTVLALCLKDRRGGSRGVKRGNSDVGF